MSKDIYLMLKNKPVLYYSVDTGDYNVLDDKLLPYPLKDKFRKLNFEDNSKYGKTRLLADAKANNEIFNSWLMNRLLPIGRENSKRISLAFGQDPVPKLKLIYLCRGLALTDNYWLKIEGSKETWESVNLRTNSLSEAIAYVALHGSSVSLQDVPRTPELTNQGAYAKAWLRRDGALWLYKKGANGITECKIEAMVSNLLDKCNVRHVAYEMSEEPDPDGVANPTCVRCKCISTEDLMIVSAMDYMSYCNAHDLNYDKECVRLDKDLYYKMMIVDYLTANRDRHGLNWGFYARTSDNEVFCMHPLFDHNNAFDIAYMQNPDSDYQALPKVSMRKAAKKAMLEVDFHFTEEIKREDFLTDRQYKVFMTRAKELGIPTVSNERIDWMRANAPDSVKDLPVHELIVYMQPAWLNYLRNSYGLKED